MIDVPTDTWIDYDYAVLRLVPHVHLCTFENVGVVLHARTIRYLDLRIRLDRERLATRYTTLDLDLAERTLDAYHHICKGGAEAGPIGLLTPSERFHWLTAPRSAVLQISEVHAGRTRNPEVTLEQLLSTHVGK